MAHCWAAVGDAEQVWHRSDARQILSKIVSGEPAVQKAYLDPLVPVSYTHLDVYKRQKWKLRVSSGELSRSPSNSKKYEIK